MFFVYLIIYDKYCFDIYVKNTNKAFEMSFWTSSLEDFSNEKMTFLCVQLRYIILIIN